MCVSLSLSLSPFQKDFVMGKSIQMGSQVNRRPTSEGRMETGDGGAELRSGLNVHIYLNGAESHMQKLPIDTCYTMGTFRI